MVIHRLLVAGDFSDELIHYLASVASVWVEKVSKTHDTIAFRPLVQLDGTTAISFEAAAGILWVDQCAHYIVYDAATMPSLKNLVETLRRPLTVAARNSHYVVIGLHKRESSSRPFAPRRAKIGDYVCEFASVRERFMGEPPLNRSASLKRWSIDLCAASEPTEEQIETILTYNDGTPIFLEEIVGSSVRVLGSRGSLMMMCPPPSST